MKVFVSISFNQVKALKKILNIKKVSACLPYNYNNRTANFKHIDFPAAGDHFFFYLHGFGFKLDLLAVYSNGYFS